MEGGPPSFPRNSTCSAVLGNSKHTSKSPFVYETVTRSGGTFQNLRLDLASCESPAGPSFAAPQPPHSQRLPPYMSGIWALPRSLTTTRGILSFPRGTKMFQFPHLPLSTLYIQVGVTGHDPSRVAPFGHPWINACRQLPRAFRSPPRPSSAFGAKASTTRP